ASSAQWQGAVAFVVGDVSVALAAARRAFELWCRLEAPYDAARARVTIGRACRAIGDDDAADVELCAAQAVFEALGAAPALADLKRLPHPAQAQRRSPLTRREREVLRLIALG